MKIVKVAREIAMGLRDVPDILKAHGITPKEFTRIRTNPYFNSVFTTELTAWSAAGNTPERVKLKSASMIEEWLPELYRSLHDKSESLTSRVKAGELAAKLAGMGQYDAKLEASSADRVQITINMGADRKLEVNKGLPREVTGRDLSQGTLSQSEVSFGTSSFSTPYPEVDMVTDGRRSDVFDDADRDDGMRASVVIE